jgi:nitrite reductase/ring-hydroxylating ferredoxin subunit
VARILCALADLATTGAKEVALLRDGAPYPIFVVKDAAGVRAFENSCPHARLPLNGQADTFFDAARTVLVCVNHGAHFDPVTGLCLRGPCKGECLRVFPVTTDGESVLIA